MEKILEMRQDRLSQADRFLGVPAGTRGRRARLSAVLATMFLLKQSNEAEKLLN